MDLLTYFFEVCPEDMHTYVLRSLYDLRAQEAAQQSTDHLSSAFALIEILVAKPYNVHRDEFSFKLHAYTSNLNMFRSNAG